MDSSFADGGRGAERGVGIEDGEVSQEQQQTDQTDHPREVKARRVKRGK